MASWDWGNFGATIVDIRHSDSTIKAQLASLFGRSQVWKKREKLFKLTRDIKKGQYWDFRPSWRMVKVFPGYHYVFWSSHWILDDIGLFDRLQEWPGDSPFPRWGSDPWWNIATWPGAVHLGWFQALWPGRVQTYGDGTDCDPGETWIWKEDEGRLYKDCT